MPSHRTITILSFAAALALAGTAESAIHVNTTAEARAAIAKIGNRAGTIVLERGRYGKLTIRDRRARRWLTIRAEPGALTSHVVVARSRRVRLIGLRVTNYWGRDALVFVTRSGRVKLERLTVVGKPGRRARVRVYRSATVTVRGSNFSYCGNAPGANCLSVPGSTRVAVIDTTFHDCRGCDFLAISAVRGMRVIRSSFDRALPGPCATTATAATVSASLDAVGPTLQAATGCNHQDLVQIVGGRHILIDSSRFGVYQYGAAQVYMSGQWPTDGVTIRNSLFQRTDPAVPDVESVNGIIVGNPPGYNGLPSNVLIEENVIESGAVRDPGRFRHWPGVANSLIVSDGYLGWPVEARPRAVGNVLAALSAPELLCATAQVAPDQGC